MDGDPAAAMRYTEAKLSVISNFLVNDIDIETVSFRENYDGTVVEPVVYPQNSQFIYKWF
jgi:DNA gyrase/topoisomerase IV subunit A